MDLLTILLLVVFYLLFLQQTIRAKYYHDDRGRLLFYPNNNKMGYVATPEQIEEAVKAFRKCFYYNIKGYNNDINRIFKDSEKVSIVLPRTVYRIQLAQKTSWLCHIVMNLILLFYLVSTFVDSKFIFVILLMCFVSNLHLIFLKLTHK